MKKLITCLLALPLLLVSCQDSGIDSSIEQEISAPKANKMEFVKVNIDKGILYKKNSNKEGDFRNRVAILNEAMLEHGIQLEKMEFLGADGAGNTVIFKDVGNKQIGDENVPDDPRNFFNEANSPYYGYDWIDGTIPYWTDGSEQGTSSGTNSDDTTYKGMTSDETLSAIKSAMSTWGSISCSDGLRIWDVYTTTPGFDDGVSTFGDAGFVQFLEGFGGFDGFAGGTILHGGNLPAAFFDQIALPDLNGGKRILGVTFTFTWNYDINQNGIPDVALKEIYINRDFNWQDAPDDVRGNGVFDYETVQLHEVGHGLNQGHFGKAFRNNGNDKRQHSPQALMNAGYSGGRRNITGTDNGGHCSIWGDWPNN